MAAFSNKVRYSQLVS